VHSVCSHHRDGAWFDISYCGGGSAYWKTCTDRDREPFVYVINDEQGVDLDHKKFNRKADRFCEFTAEVDQVKKERLRSLAGIRFSDGMWPDEVVRLILKFMPGEREALIEEFGSIRRLGRDMECGYLGSIALAKSAKGGQSLKFEPRENVPGFQLNRVSASSTGMVKCSCCKTLVEKGTRQGCEYKDTAGPCQHNACKLCRGWTSNPLRGQTVEDGGIWLCRCHYMALIYEPSLELRADSGSTQAIDRFPLDDAAIAAAIHVKEEQRKADIADSANPFEGTSPAPLNGAGTGLRMGATRIMMTGKRCKRTSTLSEKRRTSKKVR
jgi:hypothetical protein